MLTDVVHLIGAGGHSLVVIDALLASGVTRASIRLFDDRDDRVGTSRLDITVEKLNIDALRDAVFHVCIGDNEVRSSIGKAMVAAGGTALVIVHPAALVSPDASVQSGCFIAAGAIIGPLARVGEFVIVNHRAIIDHECNVGVGCHVAPGAVLGGAVMLDRRVLIGAGATVLPGIRVEEGAKIGAGAVVTADVPRDTVRVGVPARNIRVR